MYARQIAEKLNRLLGDASGLVVAGYWPIRGEPDLLPWLASIARRGGIVALPSIHERGGAIHFNTWREGDLVQPDCWKIPSPSGRCIVQPDVVVVPLVGFDNAGARLGYRNCSYDRTLSEYGRTPFLIGVGYELGRLSRPLAEPGRTPMDAIVTEAAVSLSGRRATRH